VATAAQRTHLAASMRYLLEHEPQIHYAQVRPMRTVHLTEQEADTLLATGHGLTMDCSESVTLLCRWAGLHDPNNAGYDGQGNTMTLYHALPHYTRPSAAEVGAMVVFAAPDYPLSRQHVCMVMTPGPDPLLWSHGQERGPLAVRYSVEKAYHAPPATFLSIAAL
jgi:hypothetical protein